MATPQSTLNTTPVQPLRKRQAGGPLDDAEPTSTMGPVDLYSQLKMQMGTPSPLKAGEMLTPEKLNMVYTPEPAIGDPYVIVDSPVEEALHGALHCMVPQLIPACRHDTFTRHP